MVGEGGSVIWEGARNKGKGHVCELTKNMFFNRDLLKFCQNKNHNISEFFPDTTVFYDWETRVANY